MDLRLTLAVLSVCLLAAPCVSAVQEPAQAPPAVAPPSPVLLRTLMCDRGELLFQDDFDRTTPAGAWNGFSAGEWTSAAGVLSVTWTAGHSLYHEHRLPMKDIVMQMSFRFEEGVGAIGMGMEGGPTGHALRWNFHRESIDLQRMPGVGKGGNDLIDSAQTRLAAGRWYTMVMELCGTDMIVTVDEATLLYGASDGIDCDKHSIILGADAAGGKRAWFAHCAVWRATARRDWPQKREAVKALLAKRGSATPDALSQLLQDDSRNAPVFAPLSAQAKVARAQDQIAGGDITAGCKALERLSGDKDPAVVQAAAAAQEVVATWKRAALARIQALAAEGDVFQAAELAAVLTRHFPDDAGDLRERAAQWRKDAAYAAGKEYQKLAALPYLARKEPQFAQVVQAFVKKHPGFYAAKAPLLIVK